ncbi:MAG: hypothetical protein AB7F35_15225 [Acetobacteraceae bacterium]
MNDPNDFGRGTPKGFLPSLRDRMAACGAWAGGIATRDGIVLGLLVAPVLIMAGVLIYESMRGGTCVGRSDLLVVAHWFDPIFFQYNLLLGVTAILIVPLVPYFYVCTMTRRKEVRLQAEMPAAVWNAKQAIIRQRLDRRAQFGFYAGSVGLTTVAVTLGVSILLLFKPVWDPALCGAVLSRGVNMLTGGAYIGGFANAVVDRTVFDHLLLNLVAFQFGFLGAYVYFLTALSRAYFSLDLTPETFVDGTIRIAVASILALVVSFGLDAVSRPDMAPVIGFVLGFFPKRAMLVLEKMAQSAAAMLPTSRYDDVPLADLPGVSYAHEVRLEREGFDNAQNLRHADPTDLAIRTGFSYGQLAAWIDSAELATRLREDYQTFANLTGITTLSEMQRLAGGGDVAATVDMLVPADPAEARNAALRRKLAVILRTLQP